MVIHATDLLFNIFQRTSPALFTASPGPKCVGFRGIPGGNVNTVGDVPKGNLLFRPAWKQTRKEMAAHLAMNATDCIHRATAAESEIGHVERLGLVVRILA